MEWSSPSPKVLGLLQKYILSKSGIQVVSPGDCKQISMFIEGITGKVISETTLKRFFGFARQSYNFSRFTLNALCEYAGFEGWEHFCSTVSTHEGLSPHHTMWEEFRQKALGTTRVTQLTLKNLSGIPFSATVSRAAIETDFDYFLKSDYQFFCLTGSAGMGKSIQMAHLVENFFLREKAPYLGSIVWFLKNHDIHKLTPYEFNLEESTKGQFSMGQRFTFLEHFRQHPDEVKGKLVLMLDGFDEHLFDSAGLNDVFQRIIDVLCFAQDLNWLKIAVSLRTSTWFQLQRRIDQSEYLKKTWFSGIFYQKESRFNLTPLSREEVNGTLKNIQCEIAAMHGAGSAHGIRAIDPELRSLLGYPYYLHLYYQLLVDNKRHALRGNALYCELVTLFVFRKIYQSGHSMEKIWLLQKLVRLTDYGKSDSLPDRGLLFEANELYVTAYNELISDGILLETSNDNAFSYRIDVRFLQDPLFVYFIARQLIEETKAPGTELFRQVIQDYPDERKRDILLKWIVLHIVVNDKDDVPAVAFQNELSPVKQARILILICDLLEDNPDILGEEIKKRFIEKSARFLAFHLLELELNEALEAALQTLINNASRSLQEADLLIIQFLMAVTRLDKRRMSQVVARLQRLDKSIFLRNFPINPSEPLEFLYNYYTRETRGRRFPGAIQAFIDKPPDKKRDDMPATEEIISYQLTIFAAVFSHHPRQVIAFMDVIRYLHPGLFAARSCCGGAMYLLLREAFAYLGNNMRSKAVHLLDKLAGCAEGPLHAKEYSLFKGLYGILQGEIAMAEEKYEAAAEHFLKAYKDSCLPDFVLLHIYTALPLIKVYKFQRNFDAMTTVINDVRRLVSQTGLPMEKLILSKMMEEA